MHPPVHPTCVYAPPFSGCTAPPSTPETYRKHAAYFMLGYAFGEDEGAYALAVYPCVADKMETLGVGRNDNEQIISCNLWFPDGIVCRSNCV